MKNNNCVHKIESLSRIETIKKSDCERGDDGEYERYDAAIYQCPSCSKLFFYLDAATLGPTGPTYTSLSEVTEEEANRRIKEQDYT